MNEPPSLATARALQVRLDRCIDLCDQAQRLVFMLRGDNSRLRRTISQVATHLDVIASEPRASRQELRQVAQVLRDELATPFDAMEEHPDGAQTGPTILEAHVPDSAQPTGAGPGDVRR